MHNRRRVGLLICCASVLAACGTANADGAGGVTGGAGGVELMRNAAAGAPFQAPGPRTCVSTTEPKGGAITPAQARAYVICGYEHADQDTLMLLTNVQVQVGRGRPYNPLTDFADTVDTHATVYDIRGTSTAYTCSARDMSAYGVKRCGRSVFPANEGRCFQTTFGEWRCTWNAPGFMPSTDTRLNVDPPSPGEAE